MDVIKRMGLGVAPHKTEAMFFYKRSRGAPPPTDIMVGDVPVRVVPKMKYLGLTLDGHWEFGEHFRFLEPRVGRVAGALSRLLPNIGGPNARVRALYANTVLSVLLYGAPVWTNVLAVNRTSRPLARRVQRRMAARAVRAYRTVSFAVVTALAGMPPVDLLSRERADLYWGRKALVAGGEVPTASAVAEMKEGARARTVEEWRKLLDRPEMRDSYGVIEAVQPLLAEWAGEGHGAVISYRMAQVLTGHGCFGEFLCRIGKRETGVCYHCGDISDTVWHTLARCPAWGEQRRVLVAHIGGDPTLSSLFGLMLRSEEGWRAVSSFCEAVMSRKKEAARERERRRDRRGSGPGCSARQRGSRASGLRG